MATIIGAAAGSHAADQSARASGYDELVAIVLRLARLRDAAARDGVPDYTAATFARRHGELRDLSRSAGRDRCRMGGRSRSRSTISVLRAEMNGFDFYVRVLKPWERDPAFYLSVWTAQSDTPAHEGPTNHAAIELWTLQLSADVARPKRN